MDFYNLDAARYFGSIVAILFEHHGCGYVFSVEHPAMSNANDGSKVGILLSLHHDAHERNSSKSTNKRHQRALL